SLIERFLGEDYVRLDRYVRTLEKGETRGRSVDEIVGNLDVRSDTIREVEAWSKRYSAPSFVREKQTLIKLRSFLSAKLP
ncbi:MAG: hypothetical protein CSA75_00450, partial [Sorangium cellulosum]